MRFRKIGATQRHGTHVAVRRDPQTKPSWRNQDARAGKSWTMEEFDVLIVGAGFPASINFNNSGNWDSR
jgi:hypothetical protein